VYAAVLAWGSRIQNRQVTIYSDNEAIVQVWNFGSSRNAQLMKLNIRAMFFTCLKFNLSGIFVILQDLSIVMLIFYFNFM